MGFVWCNSTTPCLSLVAERRGTRPRLFTKPKISTFRPLGGIDSIESEANKNIDESCEADVQPVNRDPATRTKEERRGPTLNIEGTTREFLRS